MLKLIMQSSSWSSKQKPSLSSGILLYYFCRE
jgi:hypothetical protein